MDVSVRRLLALIASTLVFSGCNPQTPKTEPNLIDPNSAAPHNSTTISFRDRDSSQGFIGGSILLPNSFYAGFDLQEVHSATLYWADSFGAPLGDSWLDFLINEQTRQLFIPMKSAIPGGAKSLLININLKNSNVAKSHVLKFHDFIGNAKLSGPGGQKHYIDEQNWLPQWRWYYGENSEYADSNIREKISVLRHEGRCIFDNGLVQVTDMNNSVDDYWHNRQNEDLYNQVDDNAYPAFNFLCDENPINTYGMVEDDFDVLSYNPLNDAMFYGTFVYDSFLSVLGEPPLNEKLRLRAHYGKPYIGYAFWDGAYINLGEGSPYIYSAASLDIIAHEVGHGVLNRITAIEGLGKGLSVDVRVLHEAFSDISGVMVKKRFAGPGNIWHHGEEASMYKEGFAGVRTLDKIRTEHSAIASYLDFDKTEPDIYLAINSISYPFYLLANQWGFDETYNVLLKSAKNCWNNDITIPEAAECFRQQAMLDGFPQNDVIAAFKTVKIKLFNEGVLSHFHASLIDENISTLEFQFSDNSQSTSSVNQWQWNFGDGHISIEQNPLHTFDASGMFEVKLKVTDQLGDIDTFKRLIKVSAQ